MYCDTLKSSDKLMKISINFSIFQIHTLKKKGLDTFIDFNEIRTFIIFYTFVLFFTSNTYGIKTTLYNIIINNNNIYIKY